jgi:hypothetical protein
MTYRFMNEEPWVERARQGDFTALPYPLTYTQTGHFSHLINGYHVSTEMGWGLLRVWANERATEADREGSWRGTALELWCVLFYERRRYRHADEGDPEGHELAKLDELCRVLQSKLRAVSEDERALILHFVTAAE